MAHSPPSRCRSTPPPVDDAPLAEAVLNLDTANLRPVLDALDHLVTLLRDHARLSDFPDSLMANAGLGVSFVRAGQGKPLTAVICHSPDSHRYMMVYQSIGRLEEAMVSLGVPRLWPRHACTFTGSDRVKDAVRPVLDVLCTFGGAGRDFGWPGGAAPIALDSHRQWGKELRRLDAAREILAKPPPVPGEQPATAARLVIDGSNVLLEGRPVTLDLTEESRGAAVCYLTHLIVARGEWRSSSELDAMEAGGPCKAHVGVRWDRIRGKLPACLLGLTETNRRKGNRLLPTAWHR